MALVLKYSVGTGLELVCHVTHSTCASRTIRRTICSVLARHTRTASARSVPGKADGAPQTLLPLRSVVLAGFAGNASCG